MLKSTRPANSNEVNLRLFTVKASFVKRLLALILDWVAVFIIAMPALLLYLFPLSYPDMHELTSPEMDAWVIGMEEWRSGYIGIGITLLAGLLGLFYFFLEPFTGASPAKRLLRLKIARQDGTPGDWRFFLLRAIVKNCAQLIRPVSTALSGVVSVVMTLGCFAALGEKKLALHDILAKSAVFEVPRSD